MKESTDQILVINDKHDESYERLTALRAKTGMNVKEFADYIGMPESTYKACEAANPKYRAHMKGYVIDLLEYKLTMEGLVPGSNGNNVTDWLMLRDSYEYSPIRSLSFLQQHKVDAEDKNGR